MRQLWIKADNTTIPLDGSLGIWAVGLSGFGSSMSSNTADITDGFFSQINTKSALQSIAFDLEIRNFGGSDAYLRYQYVADAVWNADKVQLLYCPSGSTTYYRDVTVEQMTKTELKRGRYLIVPMKLNCLTPWYTTETITATGTASITAGGQLGTSVKVTTTTALTNPVLTMTDSDGEFQRLELTLTTASGTALEYSNHHYDSHIYYDDEDAIQYADLSTAIFGRSRKAFTLSMTGAAMTIEVKKWWRTV